jgi:hypothetical protein
MTIPNPGTEEAIKQGCICPVIDNHHGRGVLMGKDPKPQFWYTADCPVHDPKIKQ